LVQQYGAYRSGSTWVPDYKLGVNAHSLELLEHNVASRVSANSGRQRHRHAKPGERSRRRGGRPPAPADRTFRDHSFVVAWYPRHTKDRVERHGSHTQDWTSAIVFRRRPPCRYVW
jgi:hypothetical protein